MFGKVGLNKAYPVHWYLWGLLVLAGTAENVAASDDRHTEGWLSDRGDARNQASVRDLNLAQGSVTSWEFDGSGRVWGYEPGMKVWTSAAVGSVGGRVVVFVGSYDNNLYALRARDGEELWRFTAGHRIQATPILWHHHGESWLYFTANDRLLYALDADLGRRRWIYSVESFRPTLGGARLASPCVGQVKDKAAVFVAHWVWDSSLGKSQQEGAVSAIEATTGRLIWKKTLGDNEMTSPICVTTVSMDWVFVGSSNGNLYALDADTGEQVWHKTELDAIQGSPAFAMVGGEAVVVFASKSGIVRAVAAKDGTDRWHYRTGDWVTSAPAVANISGRDLVFVGSYDRTLYALDLISGKLVWRYAARGGIYASPAVVENGERSWLVVSAWDHHLHGIQALNGASLWQRYTGRPLWDGLALDHSTWASPSLAEIEGQWVAFFGSYNGKFYALTAKGLHGSSMGRRSDLAFWLSFPVSLGCVAALAIVLTRLYRRRRPSSQNTNTINGAVP